MIELVKFVYFRFLHTTIFVTTIATITYLDVKMNQIYLFRFELIIF